MPSLRNVALTAPYFHNGSAATLADVLEFYDRHGNFDNAEQAGRVARIRLGRGAEDAIVDFLSNGLTDCRVAKERAPFDHPSLPLPNGGTVIYPR